MFGEPVQLNCNSSTKLDTKNKLSAIDTVVWEHDDEIIIDHSSNIIEKHQGRYYSRIEKYKSLAVLEIQAAMLEDSGMYTCLIFFESESSDVIGLTPWILSIQGIIKTF